MQLCHNIIKKTLLYFRKTVNGRGKNYSMSNSLLIDIEPFSFILKSLAEQNTTITSKKNEGKPTEMLNGISTM